MQRTVYLATFTPSEIDVPDRCPFCNANLRKSSALIESAWTEYTTECHLDHRDAAGMKVSPRRVGIPTVLVADDRAQEGEASYPTALMCSTCEGLLSPAASRMSPPPTLRHC